MYCIIQFDPEEAELESIASTMWVRRDSSFSVHSSAQGTPASRGLCTRFISGFGKNSSFCEGLSSFTFDSEKSELIEYRWFKDGEVLFGERGPSLALGLGLERELLEGRYHCLRLNMSLPASEALVTTSLIDLKISVPPTAKPRLSQTKLLYGQYMMLMVPAVVGRPEPEYQWLKNGFPVAGAVSRAYSVSSVNKSHEGTYSCLLKNIAGQFMWSESSVVVLDRE